MKRRIFSIAAISALLSSAPAARAANPEQGDSAPAFSGKDQDGKTISSGEVYKSGTTLLFFYPKAGTGG